MTDGAVVRCSVCTTAMDPVTPWVRRCPRCGLWRSSLEGGAGDAIAGIETLRRENFKVLLDRLQRVVAPGAASILEVGCGRGFFLDEARRRGFRCVAVEPAADTAADVVARGHTVHTGFFPDALPADATAFSVIVFNDVFEHLPDPAAIVALCRERLADDGLLVINLPNSEGVLYRISRVLAGAGMPGPFERLWQKGVSSPHLWYFSPSTLKALVESHGFARTDQFPLASMRVGGLWARLRSTEGVVKSALMYPALALLSLVAGQLPPDIYVGVFRRQGAGAPR